MTVKPTINQHLASLLQLAEERLTGSDSSTNIQTDINNDGAADKVGITLLEDGSLKFAMQFGKPANQGRSLAFWQKQAVTVPAEERLDRAAASLASEITHDLYDKHTQADNQALPKHYSERRSLDPHSLSAPRWRMLYEGEHITRAQSDQISQPSGPMNSESFLKTDFYRHLHDLVKDVLMQGVEPIITVSWVGASRTGGKITLPTDFLVPEIKVTNPKDNSYSILSYKDYHIPFRDNLQHGPLPALSFKRHTSEQAIAKRAEQENYDLHKLFVYAKTAAPVEIIENFIENFTELSLKLTPSQLNELLNYVGKTDPKLVFENSNTLCEKLSAEHFARLVKSAASNLSDYTSIFENPVLLNNLKKILGPENTEEIFATINAGQAKEVLAKPIKNNQNLAKPDEALELKLEDEDGTITDLDTSYE